MRERASSWSPGAVGVCAVETGVYFEVPAWVPALFSLAETHASLPVLQWASAVPAKEQIFES